MSNKFNDDAKNIKSFKNTSNINQKSKKIILLPIAIVCILAVFIPIIQKFQNNTDDSIKNGNLEVITSNVDSINTATNTSTTKITDLQSSNDVTAINNVDIYDLNNNIVINKLHDNKISTNLSEINTSVNDNQSVQHISDFRTHIINIASSSNLESQIYENNTYDYFPQKVIDNDMSTCWSEGIDGYGIGESITLTFDNLYEISEVSLWNGLCTNDDLFYKNSRLGSIAIVLSNGDKYDFNCYDGWDNRKHTFTFGENIETLSLTIIIQSVYEGDKYKDTCISEIKIS